MVECSDASGGTSGGASPRFDRGSLRAASIHWRVLLTASRSTLAFVNGEMQTRLLLSTRSGLLL